MRYLFPILLLAASVLLCVFAAPSVVSTLTPAVNVCSGIALPRAWSFPHPSVKLSYM